MSSSCVHVLRTWTSPPHPNPNPTCSVTSNMEVKLMCACSKKVSIPTPPHPSPTCSVTSNMALWHGRRNWHTRKASYRPWRHKQETSVFSMCFCVKCKEHTGTVTGRFTSPPQKYWYLPNANSGQNTGIYSEHIVDSDVSSPFLQS